MLMGDSSPGQSETGKSLDTPARPTPDGSSAAGEDRAAQLAAEAEAYYARVRPSGQDAPACRLCNDAKLVRTGRWLQDGPRRTAEIVPCRCAGQTQAETEGRLMAMSGTPYKFMGATLGNFEPVEGVMEALSAAHDFADGKLATLVLVGETGVGKTHLAVGAGRARAMACEAPLLHFFNVPAFLDRIRATFGGQAENEADIMDAAQACPIAIIDDLGAQRDTPWAMERIYCVVDARYGADLATIVTTNAQPDQWEPRVRSRLLERRGARMVYIEAQDYRSRQV